MVQSASKVLTVDEFMSHYGECDRYKIIDGELIEMELTGPHEQVSALIRRKLNVEIDCQGKRSQYLFYLFCREDPK